ncbi:DUF1499 domain-containing protein [Cetobacterium sp. 2A]|uniref:DUF1499 domain-containing protein n=1 Tax=unclassified Cetobacterium TaxID=2630983 RepID=UPI00163CFB07|nr:DUF1499 domain-containing protein [Cetobacterium sp. 2A]MBC2855055.1 DUF1499 domain-containing protein [Cetobacterium sp. 2A]
MKKILCALFLPLSLSIFSSPCPNSPNCVISDESDTKHYIEPIKFQNQNIESVNKALVQAIKSLDGEIIENKDNYIKAKFQSKFFKFEDDAEFYIDKEKKVIEVRSAAQSGWYDFNVNRKRIEKIRTLIK